MFKREFTYTDYNGNVKKTTRWFSLEKDEMLRLEMGNYGGLEHTMKKLMQEERPDKVLDMLEGIVLMAVGEVSPMGKVSTRARRFVKISARQKSAMICSLN